MQELNFNYSDIENGKICLSNAIETFDKQSYQDCISWCNNALNYFNNEQEAYNDIAKAYYIKALCMFTPEEKNDAIENYRKSIEYNLKGNTSNEYRRRRFFKFYDINDRNIDSILNNIRLSNPASFNDPLDCPIIRTNKNGVQYPEVFDSIRVACFGLVEEYKDIFYLNQKKWSFYANSHTGICIEFDFSYLDLPEMTVFRKVIYNKTYLPNKGLVTSGMLTKSNAYKDESEWRIVKYGNESSNSIHIFPQMIKSIYIGYSCNFAIERKIISFVEKQQNTIPVYKIRNNNNDFFQLHAERISI